MKRFAFSILAAACVVVPVYAQPLTTAITYQGRLESNGVAASGLHDFQLQLYRTIGGNQQIGPTVCVDGVSLVNGLFTVAPDFGAAFDGTERFLSISVRADSTPGNCASGAYTQLSPRQHITAAPYALKVPGIDGYSLDAADGSPLDALYVDNVGNVGIGTTTPAARVHVSGAQEGVRLSGNTAGTGSQAFLTFYDSAGVRTGWAGDGSGSDTAVFLASETSDVVLSTAAARVVNVKPNGNVGIGTTTPTRALEIHASQGTLNLTTDANTNGSVLELRNNTASPAYFGAVNFLTSSGSAIGQIACAGDNSLRFANSQERMRITSNGNVGIGTAAPAKSLHIAASGEPVLVLQDTGPVSTQAGYIAFWNANPTETAWVGYGSPGSPDFSISNARTGGNIALTPGAGGVVRVPILEITGADIAEKFPMTDKVEPGLVVAIDPANAGKLCLARGAYNHCVAGVVSGANNFSVGAVLGHLPGNEDAPPIALSGRVYVQCDATAGAIEPGDLLTTSDTPGHAMKAADRDRSQGAVLGKAMTSLASGHRGFVLVLVSLQ